MIELVGILAGIFVFISICIESHNVRSNIIMRILNSIGSILFVIYGCLISSYSIMLLNICGLIFNIKNIIKVRADK